METIGKVWGVWFARGSVTYMSGIMGNQKLTFSYNIRIIQGLYYPKKVKGYLLYY